ncbi:MLP-like protein 423 [Linum grandiflorum]
MSYGTKKVAFQMRSPANDVWTSIVAAPIVFPKAMRDLFSSIEPLISDGVTQGSIRDINFGTAYNRVVTSAREMITEIDHAKMAVKSKFSSNEGSLVPKVFDNFETTMTVESFPRGCTVHWECTFYTHDVSTRGSLFLDDLMSVMQTAFQVNLDRYLQRACT